MPESRWRVAIIDSGLSPDAGLTPVAACRFIDSGTSIIAAPVIDDPVGHGTRIARIIGSAGAGIDLLNAQVFGNERGTTAAAVAAAIDWSVAQRAHLIHLSLGLREHREVLATAISAADAAGCLLVASTPARGAMTYPARYPEAISATGDARCSPEEVSLLSSLQAEFGACPDSGSPGSGGGASVGAAHLTRFILRHCAPLTAAQAVRTRLSDLAAYRGAERKGR